MSDLLDDLTKASDRQHTRQRPQHPEGWEPGIVFDGNTGTITAPPTGEQPDWTALLANYLPPGFDADEFTVDPDTVRFTSWDGWRRDDQEGQAYSAVQYSFRAKIIRRASRDVDVDALAKWIKKARPKKETAGTGSPLVVVWADWQVGKPDGDGTRGTVERFLDSIGQVQDRIRTLKPSALYVLPAGDLGEACSGHYAQQTYRVELNEREQRKLVRRMAVKALKSFAPLVDRITVAPVGGNHGEVRQGSKSTTDFSDNRDVAVFEDCAEIFAENPDAYEHISFAIPNADLTQTLDIGGTIVGLAHGHQFRGGGTVEAKAMRWWRGQMDGRQPIGDADVLVSAHFHHLRISRQGARTWMQAPALDGGSEWFKDISGLDSPPGTLTFTVRDGGWDDLRIL